MADVAPMLSILGYDPYSNPPDYGKPDSWVQDNTFKVKANKKLWENKAKQLLKRNEGDNDDNNSNGDDTDKPDGGDGNNIGVGDHINAADTDSDGVGGGHKDNGGAGDDTDNVKT